MVKIRGNVSVRKDAKLCLQKFSCHDQISARNNLSSQTRSNLIARHRKERDKKICDRIKAVLAYDNGYSYSEITKILLLDDETVRRHVEDYFREHKLVIYHYYLKMRTSRLCKERKRRSNLVLELF